MLDKQQVVEVSNFVITSCYCLRWLQFIEGRSRIFFRLRYFGEETVLRHLNMISRLSWRTFMHYISGGWERNRDTRQGHKSWEAEGILDANGLASIQANKATGRSQEAQNFFLASPHLSAQVVLVAEQKSLP